MKFHKIKMPQKTVFVGNCKIKIHQKFVPITTTVDKIQNYLL